MEIGSSLKNARAKCGLTQGEAAQKIGVTRQTLSNWENNRSYPDVVSMIAVSKLYGLSLDALVEEDEAVKEKAAEQRELTKKRQRIHKYTQTAVFLIVWLLFLLAFIPCTAISGAYQLYGIFVPNAVMPMLVLAFTAVIGADEHWKYGKWALVPLGAFVSVSPWYLFELFHIVSHHKSVFTVFATDVSAFHIYLGIGCSLGGMLLGLLIKCLKRVVVRNTETTE